MIWTIFLFKDNNNFFAEPFSHKAIRLRSFFDKIKGGDIANETDDLAVFFQLTPEEVEGFELNNPPEKIYLYGACGQINVLQMRAYGKIREMTKTEKEKFLTQAIGRLKGDPTNDPIPLKDKEKEVRALRIIESGEGKFYRFDPVHYASAKYERG